MRKHLEKLKEKPDHHKEKIAQTAAIVVTVGIVLVWILIRTLVPNSPDENTAGPTNGFIDSFNTIFSDASEDLVDIKQEFNQQQSINELIELAEKEGIDLNQELSDDQIVEEEVIDQDNGGTEPSA